MLFQAAKTSEEKAKRALVDAARLADELRAEQVREHYNLPCKLKNIINKTTLPPTPPRLVFAS